MSAFRAIHPPAGTCRDTAWMTASARLSVSGPVGSGEIVEAALDTVTEPLCDSTWEIGPGVDLIPATSTMSTSASLGV
jgi:hypothetical protein